MVGGVLGTVKKAMVENIKKESERADMTEIQKICMLHWNLSTSLERCSVYEQND